LLDAESERENVAQRVEDFGPGAELVRRAELRRFDVRVQAFRAHASLADLVVLNRAFRRREDSHAPSESVTLVEALLAVLEIDSKDLNLTCAQNKFYTAK
jgi:hypothetical protein